MNRVNFMLFLLSGSLICYVITYANSASGNSFFSNVQVFNVNTPHRASQGIATDSHHLFLTTSINQSGKRDNIISVYDLQGKFLKERRNATNIVDRDGRFMDFGDASVIDNRLYVTLYNWHSLPKIKTPQYSKIAIFDT